MHTVVALPFAFVIVKVQSSFFYVVSGLEDDSECEKVTVTDVFGLIVRCALLLHSLFAACSQSRGAPRRRPPSASRLATVAPASHAANTASSSRRPSPWYTAPQSAVPGACQKR